MKLISIGTASDILDVSSKMIHRMFSRGELSRIKVGRVTRISYEELTAYLQEHGLKKAFL